MHVLDLRTHDIQLLNMEQKQTVDDITDRVIELEKNPSFMTKYS